METYYDVAILGAGIAGSSAAKALADKGWRTLLIDRQTFPRHKVCGEFMSPESRIALQDLGLWGTVESFAPSPIDRVRLSMGQGQPLHVPLPGTAMGISRYTLDHGLHYAAERSGVHMKTGALVTNVQQREEDYVIEVRQGKDQLVLHSRAVIAAWGAYHRPRVADRRHKTQAETLVGVKSHYTGVDMNKIIELYFFPGGYLGISPVENGRVNVAALLTRQFSQAAANTTVLSLIETAASSNSDLRRKLANAEPIPGTQAAIAPVQVNRKPVIWGQFPHIGDSAVMIPPLCGDGMSIALRTASQCSALADRYLRGEITLTKWRQEYERVFQREVKSVLFWGRLMHRFAGMPVMPWVFHQMGRLSPGLVYRLVRSTRLNVNTLNND